MLTAKCAWIHVRVLRSSAIAAGKQRDGVSGYPLSLIKRLIQEG